ncbi:MAG TPA: CHASE domain-containing protein, partial [Trichocoleus sp.]
NAVQRTQANIEERLNTYVALLRAGRGLFDVEERVSEDEFRAFIRPLGLRTQYPGVQGIGFSVRLSADEVSGSTARPRLQGSSTVTLRPAAPRDEYHAIVYLEPLDRRNQAAIGYDMFTEPVRRAAMEKARDTGLPSASGRVTLVQEIDPEKQAGFLIYLPVYEGGSVPADVSDRRSQLRGFIYSPFRVDDLIKGSLRKRPDLLVNFEIYDGLEIRPENLLHRSNRDQDQATRANLPPWLQETTVLYVAGRPWTFVFTGNAALEAASERRLVPFIVVIGGIVSLILFGLTGAQQRAWRSAKRSADRLQVSEAALLKANRQLNSILDRITDGFVALDPDFRFTYLNRASSELMKKTPEMVLGKTQWEAYPDLAGTAFEQQYRRAMEEQVPTEFEQYYAPLNIWVEVRAFPSSSGLSIYWRDISERKRAETALKEREATFQAFVSNVPGMVYRYAPFDEGGPRFTFVSSGALKLLELEPEALMADANAFFQLLYPEDLTSFHASVNYTAKNFLPWRWEGRVITPSGQLKWIQGRSTPMAIDQGSVWDGLFIDVTERKQAEQALEQTNQTLATLIDASPLSIVVIALDCTVRLWNPAATELFGWFEDEVLGKPLPIVPEEKQDECLQLRQTVGQGETVHTVETYRRRRDGSYVAVDVSAAPLCDESGEVVEIMLIWQDVTERLQAEAERERLLQGERAAREEAETANRIKDEFLAVLSHELRSPLNPILGWAKLLQERRLSEQASRQGLMTIERNAKLQTQLIEDLLDISRILRGKMALHVGPVNLVHTVEAALETVQLAADAKHLHIAQALDPEAASVIGDGARLQQIVWNLLSNAVKFTPEGGRIEVRLERVEAAGMGTWGHQGSYPIDLEGSTEPPRNALSSLPSSETLREHSLTSTSSGD